MHVNITTFRFRRGCVGSRCIALLIGVIALSIIWPANAGASQESDADSAPPAFRFGPFQKEVGKLRDAVAASISADGRIWVLERSGGVLHILDREGNNAIQHRLASPDGVPIRRASSFALSPDEKLVAIVDEINDRIVLVSSAFREDGVAQVIGRRGTSVGEFRQPAGVAWIDDETLLISDRGNDRLQIIGLDGTVKGVVNGTENEPVVRPGAVAVDRERGLIALVEPDMNRVRVLDRDGDGRATWGDWGPFTGLFDEPVHASWHEGRLFIVDRRNHRVQSFLADGSDPISWGQHELVPHEGNGRLHYPDAIAIAPDGSFGVVVESIEDRIQVFTAFDREVHEEEFQIPFDKTTLTHLGVFADIDGNLLAAIEPENHFVFLFDIEQSVPIIINRFGERGDRFGLLVRPTGIDLDFDRRSILIVDSVTRRISEFRFEYDPSRPLRYDESMTRFATSVDLAFIEQKTLGGQLRWAIDPGAIDRDSDGRVYLADKRNGCILRLASDFSSGEIIGPPGHRQGEHVEPIDIAVTENGQRIFATDGVTGQVLVLNAAMNNAMHIDERLNESLKEPTFLAVHESGRLYVTDAGSDEVVVFDRDSSQELHRFGGRGDEMGEFWKPADIALDRLGRVVVIDYGNHRAQIFSNEGEWLITFGAGRAYTRENRPRPRTTDED